MHTIDSFQYYVKSRINVVWDEYYENSIKGSTLNKTETRNWNSGQFDYISEVVEGRAFPEGKSVFIIESKGYLQTKKSISAPMGKLTQELLCISNMPYRK